ncbi:MAG: HAD-IA family hydrolase [Spirosomataceae bacterium]
MIKAVLLDFIGTTVKEKHPEVINYCFVKAFADNHVPVNVVSLQDNRGKDKRLIINNILDEVNFSTNYGEAIYASFKQNILDKVSMFSEYEGVAEVLTYLKNRSIKIGIGSGLEREVFETICQYLGWNLTLFDYVGIAAEVGRSRPHPDMILDMMTKLNIQERSAILKVGDTVADIQEGKNANVLTAVVLSGTQPKEVLMGEKPDFVLNSIANLTAVLDEM